MTKEYCANCVCLVEGDNEEWVCDECQKPIKEVKKCPESKTVYLDDIPKIWEIHYKVGGVCYHHSQYEVIMSLWEDDFSDENIKKIVCEGAEYTVDDVVNNVILTHLKTPQDIVWAFDVLQEKAKELGCPIALNTTTSVPVCLYFHDDYQDRVLVDKALSNEESKCPKCKTKLDPSDVRGYRYVCHNCDENFFECEV